MRNLFLKGLLLLLPFANIQANDQLLVIFGSSGYILYKVLDFANDHGYRYIKILSYEFSAFEHTTSGTCQGDRSKGRFFELRDDQSTIGFLCFEEPSDDPYIIDLEKYRYLIERVELAEENS